MAAIILDGSKIASEIRAEVASEVCAMTAAGVRPGLAVVLVGHSPASEVYVRGKVKSSGEVGIYSEQHTPLLFTFPRTYTSDAGLWPTRTTASPGRTPAAVIAHTSDATSARISLAILLPSRIIAAINPHFCRDKSYRKSPQPVDDGLLARLLWVHWPSTI